MLIMKKNYQNEELIPDICDFLVCLQINQYDIIHVHSISMHLDIPFSDKVSRTSVTFLLRELELPTIA